MGPVGFPIVGGSAGYFLPAAGATFTFVVLPGGMVVDHNNHLFGMIVAGWVAFLGTAPI